MKCIEPNKVVFIHCEMSTKKQMTHRKLGPLKSITISTYIQPFAITESLRSHVIIRAVLFLTVTK